MKPTEKDKQKAKRFLSDKFPNQDLLFSDENNETITFADDLLAEFIMYLESIGYIKFTANRNE